MWIPKSEADIVDFVTNGKLNETSIFDAKKELSTNSKEIAKDIAAMANEGGVLLYGVDEDSQTKRPTVLNPIPLPGERERITNIVRTCIDEPPDFQTVPFPDATNPTTGYIAVIVPPSPRAPHMVIIKGEHRYYGRTDTGNTPLNEGEVARLYARRQQWEFDIASYLSEVIQRAPSVPSSEAAYLHIVCRPVSSSDELLDTARSQDSPGGFLNSLLASSAQQSVFPRQYSPDFNYPHTWLRRADGWATYLHAEPAHNANRHPTDVLDIQINDNGAAWLFCGRAAHRDGGILYVIEDVLAGLTVRLLAFLGELYDRGNYVGLVDIGLAVTGLKGAITVRTRNSFLDDNWPPFDQEEYRRTRRTSALTLKADARSVAEKLVTPLIRATTQGKYDPFKS
jgi:hypothetical protein